MPEVETAVSVTSCEQNSDASTGREQSATARSRDTVLPGSEPTSSYSRPVNQRLAREYWDRAVGLKLG
jgi:hypothetical protein